MVSVNNNVNINRFNTNPKVKKGDIKKLVKYVNGESLTNKPDSFSGTAQSAAASALLFEGVPLAKTLMRNKKLYGKFYSEGMRNLQNGVNASKNELLHGAGKFTSRLKNYMSDINKGQEAYRELRTAVKTQYKEQYPSLLQKGKKLVQKGFAKLFPKAADKSAQKAAAKATEKAAAKAATEAAKNVGKEAVKNVGKLGKFKNLLKTSGAGIMLAIDGVTELFTEVIPTFKELGAKKGIKQAGKSAVKVAANTAGWICGAKLGTAIGTAICPGIGTAVGAAVGFVGGMIGTFLAGKFTKSVVGETEREIAKEKNEKATVNQISKDNDKIKELQLLALQRIQEEAAANGGVLSEDSQAVLQAIENIGEVVPLTEADLAKNPFNQEQ